MHTCVGACQRQRTIMGVVPQEASVLLLLLCLLRQWPGTCLVDHTDWPSSPEITLSPLALQAHMTTAIYLFLHGCWDSNSDPHACATSTLSTEHLPSLACSGRQKTNWPGGHEHKLLSVRPIQEWRYLILLITGQLGHPTIARASSSWNICKYLLCEYFLYPHNLKTVLSKSDYHPLSITSILMSASANQGQGWQLVPKRSGLCRAYLSHCQEGSPQRRSQ